MNNAIPGPDLTNCDEPGEGFTKWLEWTINTQAAAGLDVWVMTPVAIQRKKGGILYGITYWNPVKSCGFTVPVTEPLTGMFIRSVPPGANPHIEEEHNHQMKTMN